MESEKRLLFGIDINYVNARMPLLFHISTILSLPVVDNGVYNNHDDLHLYNVSYNAHTGGIPSGLYGDHGTKVAGVIGATAIMAKDCRRCSGVKIMPISICYTDNELGIAPPPRPILRMQFGLPQIMVRA